MKNIPIQLLQALAKPGRSTCYLVKIVERGGEASGFASVDFRVPFNDGVHDLVYDPDQELRPQNIQNTFDMEVDNTELAGWFKESIEQKVLAGKFDSGEITIYRVSYLKLEYGAEVVAYGHVGKIDYGASRDGKRKVEFRGLTQILNQKKNDVYSLTCRLEFGSEECGMPLRWESATVTEVEDGHMRFKVDGISRPSGYFELGLVTFDGGQNETFSMEIESWSSDGWVTLSFVTPYEITPSTAVRLRRDCDKSAAACKGYGNIINMQAEHLTPVQDQALMVPGAYIKSNNAL